ncbi:hypothetical protein PHMEG_00024689 [Phytophthora megakarya]|uniref:DDE-1 domain-containing protein n=1 Tax=Phytophthora megakarya TaxID=4795 RepID=A0A225VFA9_9STRA|nr:hypothetical protein PHMEG_00024689 [Phytophthora megakarya]
MAQLETKNCRHIQTAWMDSRVWKFYLRSLLLMHITEPSLLLLDNLDCHVSGESEAIVAEELMAVLQPLPKKLNIAKLKALWLKDKTKATTASEKRLATIKRAIAA